MSALVESERAQLGELLVRAVEACEEKLVFLEVGQDIGEAGYAYAGTINYDREREGQFGPTLPDALRALLMDEEG